MLKYMLDTNICIYAIKKKPIEVIQQFSKYQDYLCISSITLMELYYGAEKSSNPQTNLTEIEKFVANLIVLDYDHYAAAHTAQIRAELSKTGKTIGSYDAMIAGHARSQGFICVTNNIREFERVAGLRLENWWVQS